MESHTKPVVVIARKLLPAGLEPLQERAEVRAGGLHGTREELLKLVAGADALVADPSVPVDDELLDAAGPQLKLVANFAVGFDNVDLPTCRARGLIVTNTPDVLTETTADTAFALLMTAARRVGEGERFLRAGTPWIWGPLMMLGQDLHGKTLGIVGFGRIGQAMARRAGGFGMRVVYFDAYRPPPEVEQRFDAEYRDLDDLLAEADFVSMHTNLTPETHHLIDAGRLRRMKRTAVIVNTSRGPVIDEAALTDALEQGVIFAAGLDVFEREPAVNEKLLTLDNAVVIPHLGSATVETREAMGLLAADNLIAALDGRRPPTLLNPEAWERLQP